MVRLIFVDLVFYRVKTIDEVAHHFYMQLMSCIIGIFLAEEFDIILYEVIRILSDFCSNQFVNGYFLIILKVYVIRCRLFFSFWAFSILFLLVSYFPFIIITTIIQICFIVGDLNGIFIFTFTHGISFEIVVVFH